MSPTISSPSAAERVPVRTAVDDDVRARRRWRDSSSRQGRSARRAAHRAGRGSAEGRGMTPTSTIPSSPAHLHRQVWAVRSMPPSTNSIAPVT